MVFSYDELLEATENFSQERMLSDCKYRGDLKDLDTVVFITKMKIKSIWAMEEYIVKLERISLNDHLYNPNTILSWPIRFKIVLNMGSGLQYVHSEFDFILIHGNIKSSNVLLDSSFNAKLGDLGFLKNLAHDDDEGSSLNSAKWAAPYGYIDPELFITGRISTASDVYSFSIVLLEIACGRLPIILQQDAPTSLVNLVWELYEMGAILDAADARLNREFNRGEMERLLLVGLWGAHPDYRQRPSIREAVKSLNFTAIPMPNIPLRRPTTTKEHCTSERRRYTVSPGLWC
ncbi:hypothetical protein PR202_ga16099 [Eleusine coracana subsp. coracana]|uniref:Protein kinase domain-containing protein n=1 Tax=Eleusine coracana subsp. coracana TaxID=191504 RepID=A0AAV5CKN6_ELECO|nr:hypothetical protein PR202_ga16099 [Eleusine coracana subsp. coracana]